MMSLLGIAGIFAVAYYTEPLKARISDINEGMLGKIVIISGEIKSVQDDDKNTFISIADETGEIKAVYFGNAHPSGNATVTGKVSIYKGHIEIIASEIK